MKYLKTITIVLILLYFGSFSCTKFLKSDPKGLMSADNFFNNLEECRKAVNGVYFDVFNNKEGNIHSDNFPISMVMGTDEYFMPWPTTAGGMVHAKYHTVPSDSRILDYWNLFYTGVSNANMVINRISNSPISSKDKNELIAETKFFRCYYYYYLTVLFGDVPYWTDEVNIEKVSKLSSTPRKAIFDSLLTDLTKCEDYLSKKTYGANGGRVTKWAAEMLKVKVYLWIKNWDEAVKGAKDIIDNSPHRLLNNYGDIFKKENKLNDEIILGMEFESDVYRNHISWQFRPQPQYEDNITNMPSWFNGLGAYCLFQSFVDLYVPNDLRKKYCVLDSLNGKKLTFNWSNKLLGAPMPKDDPLVDQAYPKNNSGLNMILMRLGETYLELAEAENELNGPSELAYSAINSIRHRAGLEDLQKGITKEEFREEIHKEYGLELVGEYYNRKLSLIRWGKLVETVKDIPRREAVTQANDPFLSDRYKKKALYEANDAAEHVSKKDTYFPIPESEVKLNPNLKQNPLWK